MTMKPTDASRKAFSGGEDGRTQIEIMHKGNDMAYSKLTAYGQIEQGDKLVIIGRDGRVQRKKAKEVLNAGTEKEEVIISKASNSYFLVSMYLDGSSWAKAVAYEPDLTSVFAQG